MISVLGSFLLGFAWRACPGFKSAFEDWWYDSGCGPHFRSRTAATSLKTITSAQADYRANDRDGNHLNDYWRGDIAGLYTIQSCNGDAIKLIELSVASADDRPVTDLSPYAVRSSKTGYWFRALRHEDERTPSPDRFAACAFPENRAAGKYTFIVDETNTIYRKRLRGPRGVFFYPKDPERDGWAKLD